MKTKFPQKISKIIEAACQADFGDREACGEKETARMANTVAVQIGDWGLADRFSEKTAEILLVERGQCGKIAHRDLFGVVFMDIGENVFNRFNRCVIRFARMLQQFVLREQSKHV